MEFSAEIKISEKDYLQFNSFNLNNNGINIFLMFYFLFIAVIAYRNYPYIPANVIIALLLTAFVWLLFQLIIIGHSKFTYKSNKILQTKEIVYVNNSGIREVSNISDTKIAYENVYKVRESKHAIYIYIGRNAAVIIPKRVLNNTMDNQNLRGLLSVNVDPKKVKLKK